MNITTETIKETYSRTVYDLREVQIFKTSDGKEHRDEQIAINCQRILDKEVEIFKLYDKEESTIHILKMNVDGMMDNDYRKFIREQIYKEFRRDVENLDSYNITIRNTEFPKGMYIIDYKLFSNSDFEDSYDVEMVVTLIPFEEFKTSINSIGDK